MNEKKSLILMVEDEEQVLNTNCRMLRRRGYDVRIAQTAAEACHQLEEYLPDLLILDIMLPDGNGLDICRRFREKTMNPVLFLTGKSDIRDRVEGLQQGGDYYLTKPYNFDEFLAVIQMLLERQKRMEEKIKEKFQSSRQITIGSLRLDLSDGHAYLNNADRPYPDRILSAASPCRKPGEDFFCKGALRSGMGQLCRNRYQHGTTAYL